METKQYIHFGSGKKTSRRLSRSALLGRGTSLEYPRNEMGHRIYSEKEMKQLEQIINMKKDGFSLKDIEHKLSPKIIRPGNSLPGFRAGNLPK